ncbi:transcriptional regulator, TetR family [Rhodococcus rhodochrous J3]|uniref:TetR/AcrR family transcriptional regulator n=2 Tax=Rhodococcus rhodochrous TaxID=1829 RepID=A0AA46X0L0_RHORH|nr:TetR/AcrR family transcriptional regulator [Rhodococcus rhodochrous]MBF4478680.1 TetR/AcrR family transcriptional regulator [Rhodococcus rhodochrous]MCD2100185.1 TetR/AcrR family transcriptional regulator [Rhodococcus rhodochrous]MCD2124543.1 TetR/AcrR family transcriptional regulator [Rhodococcus rhodochrous]MCQ4137493.1 TetR/AcrR family transcriptional regulator [Rhodococcus rhodochrous]MDJ0021335.1 TetR/AcrR family transcriptional regulator [Rhodococcus rhodochrous]
MSENPIYRRASYGPSSPEVGKRGASTRRRIIEVSLELFAEHGFFGTSVDAIAKAADISRATLYQYFPGKDEIFLELLDECGRALFRVARRIGPLGPTEVGFDNLNWWLGEWSWVFEKYSTMFVQWTVVAASESEVRPEINRFVVTYNERVSKRLEESKLVGVEPRVAAMVMTALVHRVNLFIHTDRAYGRDTQSIVDALSVFLQLFLFPETPASVLHSLKLRTVGVGAITLPERPSTEGLSLAERTEGLTKRAANTVRALVAAGAEQFRVKGYHRTSVDDIVEAAGFARGTFYKYFSEKQDLLTTLCIESANRALELAYELREIDFTDPGDNAPREWTKAFIEYTEHYAGSIEAWTERTAESKIVHDLGSYGQASLDISLLTVLAPYPRNYPFDPILSALILRALLVRLPQAAQEMEEPLTLDESIDLMLTAIRRGFFTAVEN